jgi:hypothetical protein
VADLAWDDVADWFELDGALLDGYVLNKPVLLTPENHPDRPMAATYEPRHDRVLPAI